MSDAAPLDRKARRQGKKSYRSPAKCAPNLLGALEGEKPTHRFVAFFEFDLLHPLLFALHRRVGVKRQEREQLELSRTTQRQHLSVGRGLYRPQNSKARQLAGR